MFQAIYNSLSGLFSFSQALNTISNNVSNMNTPGFHGSDSFFEDVAGGYGTKIAGTGLTSTAGTLEQTGNPTDLAITGEGFFILRDSSGNIFYTRSGQFVFNSQGFLTDSVSGYEVMSINAAGQLNPININSYTTSPPQPTATINITGNVDSSTGAPIVLPAVTIYDAAGDAHTWTITLTPVAPTSGSTSTDKFAISIKDESGATISGSAAQNIIAYFETATGSSAEGSPQTPTTFTFTDNYEGKPQTVTLNFGFAGSATGGSTGIVGGGESAAAAADGHPPMGIASYSFDTTGTLQVSYSSSESVTGPQVALASFASDDSLQLLGGRLISGNNEAAPTIGRPGSGVFGSITGGSLELANVDLTQEFATMIVIQRGYQASSRVMTVSNQMLEDLYNNSQGGGGS
jgi:flagellar hook protein FlgE